MKNNQLTRITVFVSKVLDQKLAHGAIDRL